MAKAKLKALVDGLEALSHDSTSYFNTRTGEVVTLVDEGEMDFMDDDEALEDKPEWMRQEAKLARDVHESGNYLELPSAWDLDECQIMSDFCRSQSDEKIRAQLLEAITGKGAFRRFKDEAFDLGVIDQWYEYRRAHYEEIAIQWCQENSIEYVQ